MQIRMYFRLSCFRNLLVKACMKADSQRQSRVAAPMISADPSDRPLTALQSMSHTSHVHILVWLWSSHPVVWLFFAFSCSTEFPLNRVSPYLLTYIILHAILDKVINPISEGSDVSCLQFHSSVRRRWHLASTVILPSGCGHSAASPYNNTVTTSLNVSLVCLTVIVTTWGKYKNISKATIIQNDNDE